MHGLADLWIDGGGSCPAPTTAFGLDEFIALSQSIVARARPGPDRHHQEGPRHDDTVENPYLEGNFAPVTEEVTAVDLPVTGTHPGRARRPAPAQRPEPDRRRRTRPTYHWFTGDGMVHGLRLRDGKAEWYRNRWVRSPDVAAALGEPAPPSPYGRRRAPSSPPTPT